VVGSLKSEKDLISTTNTGFTEFITVGEASMMNWDLGILLKGRKNTNFNLELDPGHPGKYIMSRYLWEICLSNEEWFTSN